MAIISSSTIIRTISIFHLTAAWYFLTAPRIISDQNVVFVLGESMRLPHATSLDKPTEATAFIAVLLTFIGLSDLTAAGLNEEVGISYWLAQIPARLTFLFGLTAYTYLFKEDGLLGSGPTRKPGVTANLQNSLVFAFGFFEIAVWFWVFTGLREDRRKLAMKQLEKMKAEEDML